jgi:hypothetical protein
MTEGITLAWTLGGVPPGMLSRTVKRVRNPLDPSDVTPFNIDCSGALDAVLGDTITSIGAISVTRNDDGDADLEVITSSLGTDLRRVILWVAGGTTGYEYLLTLTINSVGGQTLQRSFILPVNER